MMKAVHLLVVSALVLAHLPQETFAVCDGNPHNWGRLRRCDQYNSSCPDLFQHCGTCEGIGGIPTNDTHFTPTFCQTIATAAEMAQRGEKPVLPILDTTFVNDGFHEVQIFIKRDPFCLAQIPAMVSNGSHCYKRQEGAFNYDASQGALRIDYLQSSTVVMPGVNMTEYFYHLPDGSVHPEISRYGVFPTPICPCINLGVGPVSPTWAADALYLGRELLGIEFLNGTNGDRLVVDHFVKGPHHVWTDVVGGKTVRMWQPFNGLEIFDPAKWRFGKSALPNKVFDLPLQCSLTAKLNCIDGTNPNTTTLWDAMIAFARKLGLCKLFPKLCEKKLSSQ